MSDDILKGHDVDGAEYEAQRGKALGANGESGRIVAWINTPIGAFLDTTKAAELATFLLVAAGPDAAREALAKLAPDMFAAYIAHFEELASRAELAEKRLVAVLDAAQKVVEAQATVREKLVQEDADGDPWLEAQDGRDDAIDELAGLIRSRATEGAEVPTGAAI
jgi:hypothetical protein